MFKFFSMVLEKMGSWFGIVFKIIIPIFVMYRPIKLTAFTIFIYGTTLGGDFYTFDGLGEVIYYSLYGIFILLVFLFPKVASGFEFVVIPYYFINILLCKTVEYFNLVLNGLDSTLTVYVRAIPMVALFLAGKILFFIFIKVHRDEFEEARKKKFRHRAELRK